MINKLLIVVAFVACLNACVVYPSGYKQKQVKTKAVLEVEHKNPKVVIVTKLPKRNRKKCWSHQQHWHCTN